MHITINETTKGLCTIQLDSISMVECRNMITGKVIYNDDASVLIKHLGVDRLDQKFIDELVISK